LSRHERAVVFMIFSTVTLSIAERQRRNYIETANAVLDTQQHSRADSRREKPTDACIGNRSCLPFFVFCELQERNKILKLQLLMAHCLGFHRDRKGLNEFESQWCRYDCAGKPNKSLKIWSPFLSIYNTINYFNFIFQI